MMGEEGSSFLCSLVLENMDRGSGKNGLCSESTNGGRDVWSSKESAVSSADHLVIMVNGILGSSTDWKFGAEQFVRTFPDKLIVHCSERNVYRMTLDGVDSMGERLAEEVVEIIKQKADIRRISFVAHSLGGLVARYAIGRLYRPPKREDVCDEHDKSIRGTIYGLEAMNFITVATPHLGSRGNNQVPFLFGVDVLEKTACRVAHWIFGKTGRDLFLTDIEEGKPPLLRRMVDDCEDLFFISALHAFKRRTVYSNVGYDHMVGWRTSSVRRTNELPKWEDSLSEKYPHIVYEEYSEARDIEQQISVETDGSDTLEEEMIRGLCRVSWEKIDVSFHSSRQRFAAHSVIQVKDHFMHLEGADVIQHIIDHFLT